MNYMVLVVFDAYSKWAEVVCITSTTAEQTIDALCTIFSRTGLFQQLVSDNGPQFIADEFRTFTMQNGIQHIKCVPYHQASNGLAERFVQTLKHVLKSA